jgi:hypothetical protein
MTNDALIFVLQSDYGLAMRLTSLGLAAVVHFQQYVFHPLGIRSRARRERTKLIQNLTLGTHEERLA